MKRAYAGVVNNVRTGAVRYGIFSEWPLTRHNNGEVRDEVHSLIAWADGSSFESARRRLLGHHDVATLVRAGRIDPTPGIGIGAQVFTRVL